MANSVKRKQENRSGRQKNVELIMNLFALIVLCVFPLVITNGYFNILETKYQFYCGTSIVMLVVMIGYGLINGSVIEYFKMFDLKKIIKGLTIVDWAMISFWLANVVSWIFCRFRWEAFWGTSGRYNGVFLVTIYMIVYFMVTRFFVLKKWHLDAFLAASLLVCIFGITDYFRMDIFGFKENIVDYQKDIYTSTFGNINTYTVYIAAVMVVSTILFATEKNHKRMIWYYVNMVVSCFALIMGVSDNAYLSLAALFGLSPLCLFRSRTGVSRYLISIATFFTVIQSIAWINIAFADSVIGIDSVFSIIAKLDILPILVILLWMIAGVVTFMFKRQQENKKTDEVGKMLSIAWIGVIVLVIGMVVFAIYDVNVVGNASRYGALKSYLLFNEKWGTNRGYVWIRSIELWKDVLNPFQKVFGYGADTFGLLMRMYYEPIKSNGSWVVYDSVHNEYLNYLLTIGVVGMMAYIAFLVSSIVKMWKSITKRPEVAAMMFVVLAYAAQALININLPVVMPVILQLLAMGVSKAPEENE